MVTWCTSSLTFNNCTFCPHCIYVFCIYLRTNSDLCHLQLKLIGFITEMKSVYCELRTGSLNKAVCSSSLKVNVSVKIVLTNNNITLIKLGIISAQNMISSVELTFIFSTTPPFHAWKSLLMFDSYSRLRDLHRLTECRWWTGGRDNG